MDPFATVPFEIIQNIAIDLPLVEILQNCRLSKRFNSILCQNDDFWRALYEDRIGPAPEFKKGTWKEKVLSTLLHPIYKLGRILDQRGIKDVILYKLTLNTENLEGNLVSYRNRETKNYPAKLREYWFLGSGGSKRFKGTPIYTYLLDGDKMRTAHLFYLDRRGEYRINDEYRIDDGNNISIGEGGFILTSRGYGELEPVAEGSQLRDEPILTEELKNNLIVTPREFDDFIRYLKKFENLEYDFEG